MQRALDNDTYPTVKPGKHYSKVLLYVYGEGMYNLGMDKRTQPPTCMQPPMNMHMPEYGACLRKQQPLSYIGMQLLVYTGDITVTFSTE